MSKNRSRSGSMTVKKPHIGQLSRKSRFPRELAQANNMRTATANAQVARTKSEECDIPIDQLYPMYSSMLNFGFF